MGLRFFFILITMLWAALSREHGDAQAKTAPTASKSFADAPETFSFNEWAHLEKEDQEFLRQTLQDETCPCNCAMSFQACVLPDAGCPAAPILANWLGRRLEEGFPHSLLAEITAKELAQGYNAKPFDMRTKDYASKGPKGSLFHVEYDFEGPLQLVRGDGEAHGKIPRDIRPLSSTSTNSYDGGKAALAPKQRETRPILGNAPCVVFWQGANDVCHRALKAGFKCKTI